MRGVWLVDWLAELGTVNTSATVDTNALTGAIGVPLAGLFMLNTS
jgi:hypothetical protein